MAYLLDTNVISAIVKQPHGPAAQRLRQTGQGEALTSVIVAAEARFGTLKKASQKLTGQLEIVLAGLEIMPFETPADHLYAKLRADLEQRGLTIGANDMLIAAHALALDCTLVTDNEREFRRVPNLRVENWLR